MTQAPPLTALAALAFAGIAVLACVLARWRSWTAPAAVVITAPFAWYHALGPTEITVSKAAFIGAVSGIALACLGDVQRRDAVLRGLRANPVLLPLVALAAWSALSIAWSTVPADAARDALKWWWYAGVFALTVAALEEPDDRGRVLMALFAAAFVAGAYGMYQSLHAPPAGFVAPNGQVVGRIAGTLEGPNQFGGYLEAVLPPLLALLVGARLPATALIGGGVLFGLLVADLLLTYSRGALWACSIALLTVIFAVWHSRRALAPGAFGRAGIVLACAAVVVLPIAATRISASGWQHELWAPGVGDTTVSEARRVELWTCAARLFAAHPLAGVGAGNFADVKQQCGHALAGPDHFNANEWYLETAADLGAVGLVALVTFLGWLLSFGRSAALWRDPISLGAYATLIAFVLHGLVDDVEAYPKAALSFFVLAGMLGVANAWTRRDRAAHGGRAEDAG